MQLLTRGPLRNYAPTWRLVSRFIYLQSLVVIGSIIAAFGFSLFQVPYQIAAGGVSGLGIVINHYTGISEGMLYFVLNLPLVALGYFTLGKWRFVITTMISVVSFTIAAEIFLRIMPDVLSPWPVTGDILLSCIYAGITFGIGAGLIYRAGGNIGGTSIPARLIQLKTGMPLSQSYLLVDGFIIVAAGVAFNWETAMLSILTLMLGGMASDMVIEGISQVRIAMIITDKPRLLSKVLMAELGRGVSFWDITGAYTENKRSMVYCTVRRFQISDLKYIVASVDDNAFLVIGNAQQAFGGTGFNRLKKNT